MVHVKVWLGVILTLALTALLWVIPEKLNQHITRQQQQLEPIRQNAELQKTFSAFNIKLQKTLRQLSGHSGLRSALSELTGKRSSRKNRNAKRAHESIQSSFSFYRGPQQNKRLFVFSTKNHLIYRSDKPTAWSATPHFLQQTPFVHQSLKGHFKSGTWSIGQRSFFVAAHPIRQQQKVVGALLMTMQIDREFFVELGIQPDSRENQPIILLDSEKPLAFAAPGSLQRSLKNWLQKHYATLSKKLQLGGDSPSTRIVLKSKAYGYVLRTFPTAIQDKTLGYILFAQLPASNPNDLYRGQLARWIGLGVVGLSFLLALWFSLGFGKTRKKLYSALQDIAQFPGNLKSIDSIPSTFSPIRPHIRVLMNKASQPPVPAPIPTSTPAQQPEPEQAEPDIVQEPLEASAPVTPLPLLPNSLTDDPALSPLAPLTPPHTPVPTSSEPPMLEEAYQSSAPPLMSSPPVDPGSTSPIGGNAPEALPLVDVADDHFPENGVEDLTSELEKAFTSIQEDTPLPTPSHLNEGSAAPTPNRQTLLYEQFDEASLLAAKNAVRTEHLQDVFEEYIQLRRQKGESTENIAFASFVERLEKQRSSILQQFECTDVQFHVYEKAGKAAIKATPVK